MKTQMYFLVKLVSSVILIGMFLTVNACQSKEGKSDMEKKQTPVSETTSESPSVALHTATFLGNLEALQQHIKYGSDLNKKDDYGSTPLIIAATFGKTEIAKALINAGADLNLTSNDGSTPLHTAAFFCRTEIVKALLEKGANKNIKNSYGSTPRDAVSTPFENVKGIYDQISKDLGPLGLKLNYKHLEITRPIIAEMLK
jgi:ankyrin repeat protein